jgi:hypothetical protein
VYSPVERSERATSGMRSRIVRAQDCSGNKTFSAQFRAMQKTQVK